MLPNQVPSGKKKPATVHRSLSIIAKQKLPGPPQAFDAAHCKGVVRAKNKLATQYVKQKNLAAALKEWSKAESIIHHAMKQSMVEDKNVLDTIYRESATAVERLGNKIPQKQKIERIITFQKKISSPTSDDTKKLQDNYKKLYQLLIKEKDEKELNNNYRQFSLLMFEEGVSLSNIKEKCEFYKKAIQVLQKISHFSEEDHHSMDEYRRHLYLSLGSLARNLFCTPEQYEQAILVQIEALQACGAIKEMDHDDFNNLKNCRENLYQMRVDIVKHYLQHKKIFSAINIISLAIEQEEELLSSPIVRDEKLIKKYHQQLKKYPQEYLLKYHKIKEEQSIYRFENFSQAYEWSRLTPTTKVFFILFPFFVMPSNITGFNDIGYLIASYLTKNISKENMNIFVDEETHFCYQREYAMRQFHRHYAQSGWCCFFKYTASLTMERQCYEANSVNELSAILEDAAQAEGSVRFKEVAKKCLNLMPRSFK